MNSPSSLTNPEPNEVTPYHPVHAESFRKVSRRAVGAVAIVVAAGSAIFGLVKVTEGQSVSEHSQRTEVGIERVIRPEMQKIARVALKLGEAHGSVVSTTRPAKGVTEISGLTMDRNDVGESIDVVMHDIPGTQKPDPKDVLATDIQLNFNAGNNNPKGGVFSEEEVAYIAPGGNGLLSQGVVNDIYAVNKKGWTAIDSSDKGMNGVSDDLISGTLDTADQQNYAVDANLNSVGPINTAKVTISDSEVLLPTVVDALQ